MTYITPRIPSTKVAPDFAATPSGAQFRVFRPAQMPNESLEAEMLRLRQEQAKARHDQIFGGLTFEERAAYEIRQKRLRELELQLFNPKRLFNA